MKLSGVIDQYLSAFKAKYADRLLPGHLNAIGAMLRCRTPDAGEIRLRCGDCAETLRCPHSCGHRSCPKGYSHKLM